MKIKLICLLACAATLGLAQNTHVYGGRITEGGINVGSTVAGTNTYTVSFSPALVAYSSGVTYCLGPFTNANTATSTININSIAALTIVKNASTVLAPGDIGAGSSHCFLYNGTNAVIDHIDNPPIILQNSQSSAYTTVLSDGGKQIYHPGADTTARVWTIDSNANVAYPIGTAITFVNDTSGGVITIAITSDTMILAGPGTTGSRTLAASGIATAVKITSTRWIISGVGLT